MKRAFSRLGTHLFTSVAALTLPVLLYSSPAHAEDIRLSTGEVLTVQILEIGPDTIRVFHPVLGEMTLQRASVEILPLGDTPPADEPQAEPAPEDQKPEEAKEESAPPEPTAAPDEDDWKLRLIAGAGLTEGNTENANFNAIFTATRETTQVRTVLDASYFYTESEDETTANRFSTGFRHDWLNPGSKWFYFADGRFDADEFQSWDSRLSSHVGIGRKLIEPPKLRLNAIAGIGLVKEWGSDNEDVRPEALLGIEGEWTFAEKHTLKFDSTIFPDLDDTGEFRWVNNLGWAVVIDGENNLSLTAGVQHEHQSKVDEGREKDDVRLFAGLQLDF